MASGDSVDGIIEIEDSSRGRNDGKTEAVDDESDEEEKGKGMTRGKAPSPLDMTESRSLAGGGPKTPPGITRHRSERERKLGHRRVGVGGEITYKKIQSSQIMGSIQLGIQHAVGGLASKPERDLLMQDFMTVETTIFDTEGSNHTPAHHYSDFKFKTYAPIAFRYFRDLFGIQPDDFLISMCSAPLRELSNPGASGSIFYLTADDEFIVKTVQHKEGEFLQKLLPGYYMNLNQNPRTLLPKFFGLYCYQCNSKNVRLVAMNNLLPSVIKLHQKYDLKGSTYKRKASKMERTKNSPTFKDLDFIDHHPEGIFLEADTYNALVKTIQRDCRVLESFKIMDYSLLVGIHNLDQAAREKAEKRTQERQDKGEGSGAGGSSGEGGSGAGAESGDDKGSTSGAGALNRSRSINRQRLVAHSTAMESIQAESEPIDEEEDVPPGGIPARNAKGERLLMFLGIIDILQSYRLKKKLEHTWKSMIHDGDTVSVHRPGFYAQRFQDFMAKTVFKKIPSLDLPEIKGNHRKFRTLVTSYIALKHSPSKRRSISKGAGQGRLGSLPCGGQQDAETVAPSAGEEGGGLMQSPHHAGSKPASPTAAQQTVGLSTPKLASVVAAVSSGGPSGLPQVTSPPTSTSSPAQPVVSSTATSSSPPTTTVHYPAVLKGRPLGVGIIGSPAGPGTSSSGKSRVPPPVPPRSPKRPHHGQQPGSARQGSRSSHRPRAEEDRGGALTGPGALINSTARTSNFLSPLNHCSTPNYPFHVEPCDLPSRTTETVSGHPHCPPRRSHPTSFNSKSSASQESPSGTAMGKPIHSPFQQIQCLQSPIVPPRRSHRTSGKDHVGSENASVCRDSSNNMEAGKKEAQINNSESNSQKHFLKDESNIENFDFLNSFEDDDILECSQSKILLISSKRCGTDVLVNGARVDEKTKGPLTNISSSSEESLESEDSLDISAISSPGQNVESNENVENPLSFLEQSCFKTGENGKIARGVTGDGNEPCILNSESNSKFTKDPLQDEIFTERNLDEVNLQNVRAFDNLVKCVDVYPCSSDSGELNEGQEDLTSAIQCHSLLKSNVEKFSEPKAVDDQHQLVFERSNSDSKSSSIAMNGDEHFRGNSELSSFANIADRSMENAEGIDEHAVNGSEVKETYEIVKNKIVFGSIESLTNLQELDYNLDGTKDIIKTGLFMAENKLNIVSYDIVNSSSTNHQHTESQALYKVSDTSVSAKDKIKVTDIYKREDIKFGDDAGMQKSPLTCLSANQADLKVSDEGAQFEQEHSIVYRESHGNVQSPQNVVFTVRNNVCGIREGTDMVSPFNKDVQYNEKGEHIQSVTVEEQMNMTSGDNKLFLNKEHSAKGISLINPILLHANSVPKPFIRSSVHGNEKSCQFRPVLPPSTSSSLGSSLNVSSKISGYFDVEDVI